MAQIRGGFIGEDIVEFSTTGHDHNGTESSLTNLEKNGGTIQNDLTLTGILTLTGATGRIEAEQSIEGSEYRYLNQKSERIYNTAGRDIWDADTNWKTIGIITAGVNNQYHMPTLGKVMITSPDQTNILIDFEIALSRDTDIQVNWNYDIITNKETLLNDPPIKIIRTSGDNGIFERYELQISPLTGIGDKANWEIFYPEGENEYSIGAANIFFQANSDIGTTRVYRSGFRKEYRETRFINKTIFSRLVIPTGLGLNPVDGTIYYDKTNNRLAVYNNGEYHYFEETSINQQNEDRGINLDVEGEILPE